LYEHAVSLNAERLNGVVIGDGDGTAVAANSVAPSTAAPTGSCTACATRATGAARAAFRRCTSSHRRADASGRISCCATRASGPAGTTGAVATGSADPAQATAAVRINNDAIGKIAIGGDWSVVCNRDVAACATSPGAARAT